MYEGGKTVYENGKPMVAKAASDYKKKQTRGGSSGSFDTQWTKRSGTLTRKKKEKQGGTLSRRTTSKKKNRGSSGGF